MTRKRYLRTVWILALLDLVTAVFRGFALPYSWILWLAFHVGAGLWAGVILNWMTRPEPRRWRPAVFAYWTLLALSSLTAGIYAWIQWLIAITVAMKCTMVEGAQEHSRDLAEPGSARSWETKPKGTWPVLAALVLVLAIGLIGIAMAIADKTEFRGLGLFFLHLFVITPFFLVAPALLRIPSDRQAKPYVIVLQYLIYALLAVSWLLLLLVEEP